MNAVVLTHAPHAVAESEPATIADSRIRAIDLARGLAVVLMILSHGVNGMLAFEQIPDWGMVPVHAVTKFASSLFILVFGIALAVAFVPHSRDADWPRRRWKLVLTGLTVLLWYKVLTVVELAPTQSREAVIDALLYRDFPSYVEILGFYAIALLWIPFALPLWARLPLALRLASPVLVALLAWWLLGNFDFWGVPQLQAILVEHPDYYTWGQLSRLPLVLLGLLIGGVLRETYAKPPTRRALAAVLLFAGLTLLATFWVLSGDRVDAELLAIARNAGKHPPELFFMLFSLGGALSLLALAFLGGEVLARWLRPVTLIGAHALQAFVFHIVVIFLLLRWGLGYRDNIDYGHALALTLATIAATAAWAAILDAVQRRAKRARLRSDE